MADEKRCCGTCAYWDAPKDGIYNECLCPLPCWALDADFEGVEPLVRAENGIACPAYQKGSDNA